VSNAHVAIQFRGNFGYFPPRDHNSKYHSSKVITESCYFLFKSKGAKHNRQWDALTPNLTAPKSLVSASREIKITNLFIRMQACKQAQVIKF
jgi:hypothetical protein